MLAPGCTVPAAVTVLLKSECDCFGGSAPAGFCFVATEGTVASFTLVTLVTTFSVVCEVTPGVTTLIVGTYGFCGTVPGSKTPDFLGGKAPRRSLPWPVLTGLFIVVVFIWTECERLESVVTVLAAAVGTSFGISAVSP